MSHDPNYHPHVYPTGDGERSTAGSNYGDWRPADGPKPHGYDFEARFSHPPHWQDPDFQRLRAEHARDVDERYPQWRQERYQRLSEDFNRQERSAGAAASGPDAPGGPRKD